VKQESCIRLYLHHFYGDDLDSTPVTNPKVHVERVVTLVKQSL